jgi:hypothetical protein
MVHGRVCALLSMLLGACMVHGCINSGGGGGTSDASPTVGNSNNAECVTLGDMCGPRGADCCQEEDATIQCLSGSCQICRANGESCTGNFLADTTCCEGAPCDDGVCCSIGGCTADSDCCGSLVCRGESCCIPAGVETDSTDDCCSGRAKEIYLPYPDGESTYYAWSECE